MSYIDLSARLRGNPYPGRGIILGRSADARHSVCAYFIMGRSENSRNRVFIETCDGVRTQAHNPEKMTDPSLIIYHPVRMVMGTTIVSNGQQTDTIAESLRHGEGWTRALRTRTFEPDVPHYTPRISGIMRKSGAYRLSILKSTEGNPAACQRFFYEYEESVPGLGHFIHTYRGPGTPLPSFEGEPVPVALEAPDANAFARLLWESLDSENKVSLFVRYIDLSTEQVQTAVINKHTEGEAP